MSNSFNISVAPEIAALETKVDTMDAILDDLHDTDLPAVSTLVTTVDSVVDSIRATDVPDIQTNINANETKIDTIDGIVDAIKLKTDLIPTHIRTKWYSVQFTTVSTSFVNALNVSGQGILYQIIIQLTNSGDSIELRVTLDGTPWDVLSYTTNTGERNVVPTASDPANASKILLPIDYGTTEVFHFNFEFETSLLIELRTVITANAVHCKINYGLSTP